MEALVNKLLEEAKNTINAEADAKRKLRNKKKAERRARRNKKK